MGCADNHIEHVAVEVVKMTKDFKDGFIGGLLMGMAIMGLIMSVIMLFE